LSTSATSLNAPTRDRAPLTRSILDEVTTHLDLATIRALARALQTWRGAIVLITHDR
jgi:DNA repair exonuclease SbcCD ATPase subunit